MLFKAEDEGALKKWITRRLEDISDADADVLADYVLALLRHDSPEEEVRKLCVEQLEDFLKEHTATFVNDIFQAVSTRSYDPSAAPIPGQTPIAQSFQPSAGSQSISPGSVNPEVAFSVENGASGESRKRTFNDYEGRDPRDGRDGLGARGGGGARAFKQPRRGSFRGGKLDNAGVRGGRGGGPQLGRGHDLGMGSNAAGVSQSPPLGFPGMPQPPPGFPFDPNDPMGAIMAMQAMGFPPLPGMPPFPQVGSPSNFSPQAGGQGGEQRRTGPKVAEKCKDYDEKGFCALGNTCPYQHGPDHMVVPDASDEYDPNNASLMLDSQSPGLTSKARPEGNRGKDFSRGRGRGRGGASFVPGRKGRADFSHAGPSFDRSITTVVVENIPEDKFDEQTVRDFFSDFGPIQEVQMQAYKRLALVKYDDWPSAKRAYESPKVIFDNRFVKVYWYKPDATGATNGHGKASSETSTRPESPQVDMEEVRRRQEELQKAHEEKMKKIKEAESSKAELEKRREELMKNQAEEKRKLLERIAAKTGTGQSPSQASPTPPPAAVGADGGGEGEPKKTSSQTEALRAQLAALEAEAQSLGIDASAAQEGYSTRGRGGRGRPPYRGRGSFAPRGRGYEPSRGSYRGRGAPSFGRGGRGGAYKLDNRTKKVAVSGVDFDDSRDEALRQYLLGVGEFENIEPNPDRPDSQLITFKDRFTAEKFVYGASEIPSVGKVEMSWVNMPLPPVQVSAEGTMTAPGFGGDETMRESDMGADDGHKNHEDYDVAEDDDRWMIE